MVSTRFVHDYSMAKTRSRSLPKFFLGREGINILKNKLNSPGAAGYYRQLNGGSPSSKLKPVVKSNLKTKTKPSNAQIKGKTKLPNVQLKAKTKLSNVQLKAKTKLSNVQLKSKTKLSNVQLKAKRKLSNSQVKVGKSKPSSSLKGKMLKKVSTATKLVRPCKLGNKVNCVLHKSNIRRAHAENKRGQKGKKVKKQSKESVQDKVKQNLTNENSPSGKVTRSTSRTQILNRVSRSTALKHTTSVGTMKTALSSGPVHTTPKHSTAAVQIIRMDSSRARLSPVTFKKQIRNLLQQAIARKQNKVNQTSESKQTRKLSTSNEMVNAAVSWTRRSLSDSKYSLPQTKNSLPNQTSNEQELMRASSIPNLVISNKTNVNVPNLDLSTTRSLASTTSIKKSRHSSSQNDANAVQISTNSVLPESVSTRSKSLESAFNSTTGLRKVYNTRRSCFYREKIPTINLDKESKCFNGNHIVRKNVVETRRVRNTCRKENKPAQDNDFGEQNKTTNTSKKQNKQAQDSDSGGQNKTTNDIDHAAVPNNTYNKSEQNDIISMSTSKTSAKKKERTELENETVIELPRQQRGNENSDFQRKMINLMTTKFGSYHTKPNQNPSKHQKDLDDEPEGIVDELAAVDSYVQARILSFKAQNESESAGIKSSRVSSPKKTITSQPTLETNNQRRKNDGGPSTKKWDKGSDMTRKSNDRVSKLIDKTNITSKSMDKVNDTNSTSIDITNDIGKKSVDKTNDIAQTSTEVNDMAKKTLDETNVESVSPGSASNEKVTADLIATNIVSNDKHNDSDRIKDITKSSHVDSITTEKSTKTRTKLPLTLKSKIVTLNGKKVKKKLSQNEKRIYNLLRCYGGSSIVPQSSLQTGKTGENDGSKNITGENNPAKKNNASSEIMGESPHERHKEGVQSDPKKVGNSKGKECEEREKVITGQRREGVQLTPGEENASRKQAKENKIKYKSAKDEHNNGKETQTTNNATKKTVIRKETREECTNIGDKTKECTPGKSENYAVVANQYDGKDTTSDDASGSKYTGSKNTKTSHSEKSVSPEYKEKRLQHKAKYNIIKEFKFSPSKVDKSYVNRKKARKLRDCSSEDEWTDEEEKREEIGKKEKGEHKRKREDRRNQDQIGNKKKEARKHTLNNKVTPNFNAKRNNQKGISFKNKSKATTNIKEKIKSRNKSVSRKENVKANEDKQKERSRLTYNSSGTDSSDNEFFEAYNEDNVSSSSNDVDEHVGNKVTSKKLNNNTTASDMNDSNSSTDSRLLDKYKTNAQKQKKPIKRNSSSPQMKATKTQRTDNSTAKTPKTDNSGKTQNTHVQFSSTDAEKIKTKNQNKHKKALASKDYTPYINNGEGKKHRPSVQDTRPARTNDFSNKNNSTDMSSPNNLTAISSNGFAQNSSNSFVEQLSDGIVHSDEDIFDDPVDERPSIKQATSANGSVNSSLNSSGKSGTNAKMTSPTDASRQNQTKSSQVSNENKIEFKEIVNEHVNKYKTKDLVENFKHWTDMENGMKERRSSSRSSKEKDVGNYRDYTTRRLDQNPVRILKKKKCEDLKKQMNNEYKNGRNGKDYFQCICFNKFFITRVRNKATGHFDILNVKVKPNKSENIVSISDVEFCTFCSRLHDKYKDSLILINQEYIINEFIQRHSNDWNKLNKSYDNDTSLMSPSNLATSLCNCSFVSTATAKSCESHTGSRLDSMSSEMTMGSDYSDYYLNEIFLKKARDVSKLASSHEFARLKQKCRNVNLKINELCDLYKASPRRISSTETRSNMTDDTLDDGVFTRPTPRQGTSLLSDHSATLSNPSRRKNTTPCKSMASQTSPDERDVLYRESLGIDHYSCTPPNAKYPDGSGNYTDTPRCHEQYSAESERYPCTPHSQLSRNSEHYPCTPLRSRHHYPDSNSMDEGTLCPASKQTATPNSFTCSRTPNSIHESPRKRDHLFRTKIEKTKESFDRLFNKVWRKCSPVAHHRKRGREYTDDDECLNGSFRRSKKLRQSDLGASRRSQLKRLNQSQLSTDFSNDEYDADFSDSDGNENASSGDSRNNMVEHRRHFVNKLFIKQSSSRQLFTNKKTSYSDSEQVVKIQNVKKKVYTTIQRKVYRTQTSQHESKIKLNHDGKKQIVAHLDETDKQNRMNCKRGRNYDDIERIVDETPMKYDSSKHSMDETEFKCIANNKISYLQDKIQQIQYNNLWSKLTEKGDQCDFPSYRNRNQTPGRETLLKRDTDNNMSDIMIETEDEQGYKSTGISSTRIDNETKRNKESSNLFEDTRDLSTVEERGSRIMSPDTTNESYTTQMTIKEENSSPYNLMKEILIHKMNILNTCEHIKEQVEKYANAVNQNIEPLNKTYVLKLLKKLMKCQEVSFEDYANVLIKLNINLNINDKNQFLIKHGSRFSEQDELIMKQCYDKLYVKYQKKQSEIFSKYLGLNISEDHVGNEPKHSTQPLVEHPVDSFESFKADLNRNQVEIDEKTLDNDHIELEITSNNEIDLDGITLNNISEDGLNITLTGNKMDELNITIPQDMILS